MKSIATWKWEACIFPLPLNKLKTLGHAASGIGLDLFRQIFKAWVIGGVQIGWKVVQDTAYYW